MAGFLIVAIALRLEPGEESLPLGVSPHTLRHSFASRLRENGAPIDLISECLGHVDVRTTMIYAKITTKKRHEDLALYLEGPAEPGP